jgi:hypothetical protein
LVSGHIDSGEAFWWDDLAGRIRRTHQATLDLRGIDKRYDGALPTELPLGAARERSISLLAGRLRALHPKDLQPVLSVISDRLDVDGPSRVPALLSWDQVREMHDNGVEFGAHTVSHPNLGRLEIDAAEQEIRVSMNRIESEIDSRVNSFAYPYGMAENIGDPIASRLARLGVHGACSAIPGLAAAGENPYRIPRLSWSAGTCSLSAWKLHRHLP